MPINIPILITGINGFIGKALNIALKNSGFEVWGISLSGPTSKHILKADLCNISTLNSVREKIPTCPILIHTASMSFDK